MFFFLTPCFKKDIRFQGNIKGVSRVIQKFDSISSKFDVSRIFLGSFEGVS